MVWADDVPALYEAARQILRDKNDREMRRIKKAGEPRVGDFPGLENDPACLGPIYESLGLERPEG